MPEKFPPSAPMRAQLAAGDIGNFDELDIFGCISSLPTTFQDLWEGPTAERVLPLVAGPLTIVSDNANDVAPSGTGCRAVLVKGVGATGGDSITESAWLDEVVPLNGLNAVNTVNSFLQVVFMQVVDGTNQGTVRALDGGELGDEQLRIGPENGRSKASHIIIPTGWVGFIGSFQATWTGASPAEISAIGEAPDRRTRVQGFNGSVNAGSPTFSTSSWTKLNAGFRSWIRARRVSGSPQEPFDLFSHLTLRRL